MEILRWILASAAALGCIGVSLAKDSQELSAQRRKIYEGIDFYCPIGRAPIATSDQAWTIQPTASCTFDGPLDTKINRLRLEPPVLNPNLTMAELVKVLQDRGIIISNEEADHIDITLPSGTRLKAELTYDQNLADNLMKLAAYPASWKSPFVTIVAEGKADLAELIQLTSGTTMYWANPYVAEETTVLPRLQGDRPYLPVNLVSRCNDEWKTFGGSQSLLLVGDLHTAKETDDFTQLIQARSFSWVALEMASSWQSIADEYMSATDPIAVAQDLQFLVSRHSKDVQASAKILLATLKHQHTKTILMDYEEAYFNFPYTSTSFHGLVVATRNALWVSHLPAEWRGTGALLGGVDHFTVTPNADFQNFAQIRFPQVNLALINPYEVCERKQP